ncbi:MAG: amidase [Pseudomonadales bacterium]|nr:amidase [Pseudomonadales bacterium]MDA0760857.1 amidase [Pseudomonadota bacterium]MDA0956744.1 amidase [Pseudomonadota bacterium]
MADWAHLSATDLAEALRTGAISSVALTDYYIERIERLDPSINVVVVRTFEEARRAAKAADEALASGRSLGPLHGIPMTIKESYVLSDTPTTWGLEAYRNNVSKDDGLIVSRFKAAGAHFLGKTNVPVNLADFQSYNPIYGVSKNPWNPGRTPGGSSGGSAAALAAGFSALEAGSDIGGSIRNPAHFCGVYGHKPTFGLVPMQGHALVDGMPEGDLSVCGPLARSAEDLRLALSIMAGPSDRPAVGWQLQLPRAAKRSLADYKVAIWATDALAPVANDIEQLALGVGAALERAGAIVSYEARPSFDAAAAHENYQTLLNAAMSLGMDDAAAERIEHRVAGLASDDASREAIVMRAAVMSHRDWLRANIQREALRRAWDEFFRDWDLVICPQMATTAFEHDHRPLSQRTLEVNAQARPYFEQLFWAGLAINAYLPSTVFPVGLAGDGLPVGLQAIGAPFQDDQTISFAQQFAEAHGGFLPPPAYASDAN